MTIAPLPWLAGRPWVRRTVDGLLTRRAARRVAALDRCDLARVQERTLLHLVKKAAKTRFGLDHDFGSVRSVKDYQERVPLRDYEAFWTEYWSHAYPRLQGMTWPSRIPYLALSSGTTSGTTKYIPISTEMLASNRRAGLTTLALYQDYHKPLPLFTGRMFFLGGSTDLRELTVDGSIRSGDLSGIAIRELSSILRPYVFPPLDLALLKDWEEKLHRLAEESLKVPISMVSGVPSWMLVLFERLQQITGKEKLSDIWPSLRMVIHGGTKFDPYRSLFDRILGSVQVRLAETYPASEGFLATEDPRHGLLRIIPDHGLFYEFVPTEDLKTDHPRRFTLSEVEVGVQYAVVLTSCAGVWSYVLGDTIRFERRDPPLIRFTGRTSYYLSAFGEHLISEEVERAVTDATSATGATVTDFHVGPLFPESAAQPGRHLYLMELTDETQDALALAARLDATLCKLNEDYEAHRAGDLTMLAPVVCVVKRGGFKAWMESRGKLGGQHKVPRMDSTGKITAQLRAWLREHHYLA